MQSDRGALVLGAAAFESAVKRCISSVAPETEWLLQQRTAPPALQLLNSYLPTLARHTHGGIVYPLPASYYRQLEDGLKLRNKVVHDNHAVSDRTLIREFLRLVRDILFLLDYYAGSDWALPRLSASSRTAFGI
jgi:hypothetical protein